MNTKEEQNSRRKLNGFKLMQNRTSIGKFENQSHLPAAS